MNSNLLTIFFACVFASASPLARGQDHGHLNAGAASANPGSQLIWDNGADFIATSGYVKSLDLTNSGRFAGFYQNNITLTALPATAAFGGPAPNAPALGSLLVFRMSLVSGPPGGRFVFWETNSTALTGPAISVGTGETATNFFRLSQTDGSPTADPFGHIHNRRFSATQPGIYQVGFQAIDVSTNGLGGGPIHTPSSVLPVWFQAGINIASVTKTNSAAAIIYGAVGNRNLIVDYSTNLAQTNWTGLVTNLGNDAFQIVHDLNAAEGERYYRVRVTLP
jgi:hypothetical protein